MRIAVFFLAAAGLWAQTFEVTSVKPNHTGSGGSSSPHLTKGKMAATNTTVKAMLEIAYGLSALQVTGPDWIDSDRFDLAATSPEGVADSEIKPMLQALLKDRFHLAAHLETRELPVYSLVVAKEGLKIKPYDPNGPVAPTPARMPGAYGMMMGRQTMAELAEAMAGPSGRPVVDKTGIEGRYVCIVQYSQLGATSGPDQAPDIFGAVQQQLGLKLEPARAPVQIVVVDHIERTPTEN